MKSIVLAALLALFSFPLHGAVRTWTGAVNDLWSNPGNWDTGTPLEGDALAFTDYTGGHTINDLPAGMTFQSILASGGEWTFEGNGIAVRDGIRSQSVEFDFPIRLDGSQDWLIFCCHTPKFFQPIELGNYTWTWRTSAIVGGGLDVTAPIIGPGGIDMLAHRVTLIIDDPFRSSIDVVLSGGTLDMNNKIATVRSFEMKMGSTFLPGNRPLIVESQVKLAGELFLRNPYNGQVIIRNDGIRPVEGEFDLIPLGPFTVTYTGGDGNDVVVQGPELFPTTTTVTSTANPVDLGTPVTLIATVDSVSTPVTGSVTFRVDGNAIATIPLNEVGQAGYTTAALPPGVHRITATYDGSSTHATSTSTAITLVVSTSTRRRTVRH